MKWRYSIALQHRKKTNKRINLSPAYVHTISNSSCANGWMTDSERWMSDTYTHTFRKKVSWSREIFTNQWQIVNLLFDSCRLKSSHFDYFFSFYFLCLWFVHETEACGEFHGCFEVFSEWMIAGNQITVNKNIIAIWGTFRLKM